MRAGDMDRRVTIERFTETRNEFNEPIQSWDVLAAVWARVTQESGREFLANSQVQSSRKVIFLMRWVDGVTVLDRVAYGGRNHDIQEVRELGRKEGLELHTIASG